jgi:hypothetical protein
MMEFEQILEEYEREWSSSCSGSSDSEEDFSQSPPASPFKFANPTIIHAPVPHNFIKVEPFSVVPKLSLSVEDKANVGTSAPLTVSIGFGESIDPEDVVVADTFVPEAKRSAAPYSKFVLYIKVVGESSKGELVDLTHLRCDKCKQRMRNKNKEESESNRFVDVLSSKIQQTRKREGSARDAIQLHFHCTPVKCHKLKSFVTLEIALVDHFGRVITAPNQSAKMNFRTADKRIKEEVGEKSIVSIPTTSNALQKQVDRIFRDLEKNHDLEDRTLNKLSQLQQLICNSLQQKESAPTKRRQASFQTYESDEPAEPIVKRTRKSKVLSL